MVATVLAVAGCQIEPELGSNTSEIIDGTATETDPAVVAITHQGGMYCTGSLIADRVVLTAAHCLPPNVKFAIEDIFVFVGDNALLPDGFYYSVAAALGHEDFQFDPIEPANIRNDIGVLILNTSPGVTPIPVLTEEIDEYLGSTVRSIGFGITDGTAPEPGPGAGIKRTGTLSLDAKTNDQQVVASPGPSLICSGDSGGPSLINIDGTEFQFGIHSWGDQKCLERSGFERIDVHLGTFIGDFVAEHAPETCVEGEVICTPDHVSALRAEDGGGCNTASQNTGVSLLLLLVGALFGLRRCRATNRS